ncbi:MAG: cyclic nucleotide-binding domain-containing protein [Candidatus Cloacimonetes bacterium]|nr:cyclic nucleotide-binding domain-containing protein [Candidatus Cloacimonadota bacterium]
MDINLLKKIPLFTELNTEELKIVASCLKSVKFKEGEYLFKENETGNELYILFKGQIGISKKMTLIENRNEVDKTFIVLCAEQNVFFGEIGLLGYKRRTASASAKTDCELFSINQTDFNKISKKHPQIGFKILLQICLKLSNLLEKTDSDILKLTTALIYALNN